MERVVVSGVQTPNCIRGTVYEAVSLDYPQASALCCRCFTSSDLLPSRTGLAAMEVPKNSNAVSAKAPALQRPALLLLTGVFRV